MLNQKYHRNTLLKDTDQILRFDKVSTNRIIFRMDIREKLNILSFHYDINVNYFTIFLL